MKELAKELAEMDDDDSDGGLGSMVSTQPGSITEMSEITPEMINSLMTGMNSLAVNMKKLGDGMYLIRHDLQHQQGQVSMVLDKVQGLEKNATASRDQYKKDSADLRNEIDQKLAALGGGGSSAGAASSSSGPTLAAA